MEQFPQRLKALRLARGLSQSQLAARIPITPIVISRYERGAIEPTMRNVERLARALDVRPSELIDDGPVPALPGAA